MKSRLRLMFKFFLKGLLCMSFTLPGVSFASASASTSTAKRAPLSALARSEATLRGIYAKTPNLKAVGAKASPAIRALSHPTQTMLLIWILAGVETYRQQNHLGPLNEKEFDPKMLLEILDLLVNDLELYSGMIGASTATAPLAKPFADLKVFLQNKVSRALFVEFIHSGAVSFVTFVGWEASSQLWKEAIFHLSEDQIETAEGLRFGDLLFGRASEEERQVFQQVVSNVYEIFTLKRPEQARDWIYNTWRLRLATGEFLTLVTGMVGGSVAAGTLLAPGAGSVAGFFVGALGGLAGGALTLALPESWKSAITSQIRGARSGLNHRIQYTYNQYLREIGHSFEQDRQSGIAPQNYQMQGRMDQFRFSLKNKRLHRNRAATAHFEEIYDCKVKLQEAVMIAAMSAEKVASLKGQNFNPNDFRKLTILVKDSSEIVDQKRICLKTSFQDLIAGIRADQESLNSLLNHRGLFFPSAFAAILSKEIYQLDTLVEQIQLIAQGTLPEDIRYYDLSKEEEQNLSMLANNYVNISHARGFDEEWFDD